MRLSSDAIYYMLKLNFDDVILDAGHESILADYPMLYDISVDMSGHTVLVPDHERPSGGATMRGTMCVCMGQESAAAARKAGLAVAVVGGDVTFPQLYNSMLANYVRNERMDAQLNAYVTTYAGFQPLLDACADAMGISVALVDAQYRLVAYANGEDALEQGGCREDADFRSIAEGLDQGPIDLFMASREYQRLRSKRAVFAMPGFFDLFMKNVFYEGEAVGALIMRHRGDALSARFVRFLLGYLVPFVEQMYANRGSFVRNLEEADRVRKVLAAILEGGEVDYERADELLIQCGHEPDAWYCLLLIDRSFSQEGAEGLRYLARRIDSTWLKSYAMVLDQELFVLAYMGASGVDHAQTLRTDLPELLRDIMAKAGVSRMFNTMGSLAAASTQARIALRQGKERDPMFWYYRFDDYAFDWLVAHGASDCPAEHIVHPAIVILKQYDAEFGADLLRTLEVFMESRYNASLAAQRLFIARSTLINRLARIEEIAHVNLYDLHERTHLALSFAIMASC